MANHNGVIVGVDLRSHENNQAHRTREIDRERLIVRRGQPFSITLQMSNSLPPKHHLALVLHLGKKDQVVIKVQTERGAGDKWWFGQQGAQGETLLTLHSPADALIGQYRLAVLMMSQDGRILEKSDYHKFYLLFNPWCKDDAVYLPDESLLQEYVMNEDGIIYTGTWDSIYGLPWSFGQFEDRVVDICFEILDNSNAALRNSEMDTKQRSDPVYVSRTLTAMVNSNDDRGVVAGRWQEPYSDGVVPSRWTGSVPILRQWSKAGAERVKYGQCWVFAGVACTVLRCLGIPTRCITNFSSAHDVDGNLSLDVLFNEKLESLGGRDSSWNFHCWVESWMRREDLSKGYNGWQVLDPTPQELSEGVYCCGPCPVTAIKEGDLGIKYDAPFVFAEVNADIIHWIIQSDGQRRQFKVDQSSVGMNISTKSVYGDFREDVTLLYKYPEGSQKEREVYEKAGRPVSKPTNGEAEPGELQLSIKPAKPVFGTDFDVIVEVKNVGGEDTTAQLTMLSKAVTYNSLHRGECQRRTANITVPAHSAHREVLRLRYDHYAACVSEHHVIRVIAMLEAPGQNEPLMDMVNIPLSMPELQIQVLGKTIVYEQVTAHVSFTNPLPVQLKGGVFTVEGAGLLSATEIPVHGDIAPGQEVSVSFSFTPMRHGVRKLLVDFDSDRLRDVKGVATLLVHRRARIPMINIFG
ncbi:protein-glutamine gamma-glutamyltransferase 2-like [Centroberyx affinis]|uniref:protein-glutamine gamma-glutamyltransferase 2-like n=1 Tax=Centroberyx affinis TaxID=166261 RepID=UPI003A5BB5B8